MILPMHLLTLPSPPSAYHHHHVRPTDISGPIQSNLFDTTWENAQGKLRLEMDFPIETFQFSAAAQDPISPNSYAELLGPGQLIIGGYAEIDSGTLIVRNAGGMEFKVGARLKDATLHAGEKERERERDFFDLDFLSAQRSMSFRLFPFYYYFLCSNSHLLWIDDDASLILGDALVLEGQTEILLSDGESFFLSSFHSFFFVHPHHPSIHPHRSFFPCPPTGAVLFLLTVSGSPAARIRILGSSDGSASPVKIQLGSIDPPILDLAVHVEDGGELILEGSTPHVSPKATANREG